jgi:hypothetical protein
VGRRQEPDRSAETKTLIHWIEQGSPRGDGADVLAANAKKRVVTSGRWASRTWCWRSRTYTIPASGVVDYQNPIAINPADRGQVGAGLDLCGQPAPGRAPLPVRLHQEVPKDGKGNEDRWGASMGGYAVGAESTLWPKNVGTYLPPGGAVGFQAHYTPFGKEVHRQVLASAFTSTRTARSRA